MYMHILPLLCARVSCGSVEGVGMVTFDGSRCELLRCELSVSRLLMKVIWQRCCWCVAVYVVETGLPSFACTISIVN